MLLRELISMSDELRCWMTSVVLYERYALPEVLDFLLSCGESSRTGEVEGHLRLEGGWWNYLNTSTLIGPCLIYLLNILDGMLKFIFGWPEHWHLFHFWKVVILFLAEAVLNRYLELTLLLFGEPRTGELVFTTIDGSTSPISTSWLTCILFNSLTSCLWTRLWRWLMGRLRLWFFSSALRNLSISLSKQLQLKLGQFQFHILSAVMGHVIAL